MVALEKVGFVAAALQPWSVGAAWMVGSVAAAAEEKAYSVLAQEAAA